MSHSPHNSKEIKSNKFPGLAKVGFMAPSSAQDKLVMAVEGLCVHSNTGLIPSNYVKPQSELEASLLTETQIV